MDRRRRFNHRSEVLSAQFCEQTCKPEELAMAESFLKAPTVGSVRLINFTRARVVPGIVPCTFFLIVSGTKPYLNMTVELSPLIYIRQPEYWGIEVVGALHGIGIPVTAPYTVFIPLNGILGTKGIEVI